MLGVRWIVAFDSPVHAGWNAMALAVDIAAIVSWRRTPSARFTRAGTGRWWVLLLTLGLTAVLGGYWLPVGALVWFAYWRPRLRRSAVPAVAASPPCAAGTSIPGEPLV